MPFSITSQDEAVPLLEEAGLWGDSRHDPSILINIGRPIDVQPDVTHLVPGRTTVAYTMTREPIASGTLNRSEVEGE